MITITLEGESWRDILREMSIIEASVRGSRIEDLPDKGIVAPDEREGHDGPKKPLCEYCGGPLDWDEYISYGIRFCSKACADRYDHSHTNVARIDDRPGQADIAKAYEKCPESVLNRLRWILAEYFLGPEERAEILERMR